SVVSRGTPPVHAVTFDFWNTIVAENAVGTRRGPQIVEALEAFSISVTTDEVGAAFGAGWDWFVERWKSNAPTTTRDSVEVSLLHLPVPTEDPLVVDAITELVAQGSDPASITLAPGIGECLERLAAADVRLGIICDVGMTPSTALRRYLEFHDLLGFFDHWSFSDEVGCYKPDARIFAHAAAGLGQPDPERTAHVGDLRRTDVAGARGVGWTSVRYHGLSDDPRDEGPEAHLVVAHHYDLPAALGVD
ncbi:MAG: HAD family hydrolase, partial [Actinomycetes bacterium]